MYRCEQRGFEELGQSLPLKLTMRGRVKDNRKTIPGTRQVRKTCPAHCPQTATTQPACPVPGDRRSVRRGHLRVWGRGGGVGGSQGAGPRRGERGEGPAGDGRDRTGGAEEGPGRRQSGWEKPRGDQRRASPRGEAARSSPTEEENGGEERGGQPRGGAGPGTAAPRR